MSIFLRKVARVAGGLILLAAALVLLLVFWPAPKFATASPMLSPSSAPVDGPGCGESSTTRCLSMRDGVVLHGTWFESGSDLTVLLFHGVMSQSGELAATAKLLQETIGANVLNVDLRGHGLSEGKRGDISTIGQYEDDIADIVTMMRQERPSDTLILAGHSMGGGIIMRYAARQTLPQVDAYLLFAPHLGTNAPTSQPRQTEAAAENELVKISLPRTVGLALLNTIHVTVFNGLDTLFFNVPADSPLGRYSYRAMVSTSPDDYQQALTADSLPLLVVVGQHDEAFLAEEYPNVIQLHENGEVAIIANETHDSIVRSAAAFTAIQQWVAAWRP